MNHFNNLKTGFMFIEMMFAIALFAIFGTSLFMTQSYIFSKVFQAHHKIMGQLALGQLKEKFDLKLLDQRQKKESIDQISIREKITDPVATISMGIQKISENSVLYKKFAKYVHLVKHTVQSDTKIDTFYTFLFSPPSVEKKES